MALRALRVAVQVGLREGAPGGNPKSLLAWCVPSKSPFSLMCPILPMASFVENCTLKYFSAEVGFLFVCLLLMWIGWAEASSKHLQILELYNLFISETKASSSKCVQTARLHLAEASILLYKKDPARAVQTAIVNDVWPLHSLCCTRGCLKSCCRGDDPPLPLLQQSRHPPPEWAWGIYL